LADQIKEALKKNGDEDKLKGDDELTKKVKAAMKKRNGPQKIELNEVVARVKEILKQKAKKTDDKIVPVSKYVNNIFDKVPVIRNLERRLDIMKGLDPLMDGILQKMAEVTDNTNLKRLKV